jgi:hypothetical protein
MGKGLVSIQKSVPLVTGGAIHRGIEHSMHRIRLGQPVDVDTAVGLAVEQYIRDCEEVGFRGKTMQSDKQQWFTFCEQKALTEALIRCWNLVEYPNIVERYKVISVEREVVPIQLAAGVWFQARVDAEMQEIQSGDFVNYSLKSMKEWNERSEESYKSDLQGITESWAVEEESRLVNHDLGSMLRLLDNFQSAQMIPIPQIQQIRKYLLSKTGSKKVMAVRFCILIKGTRKKPDYYGNDPDALYITYNSLIRGYKQFSPSGIAYAHSWFYPNPNNKSGRSTIGKGWEPFNIWESDISIKQWVDALWNKEIQPECGDIIRQYVVTPTEYFRSEEDIRLAISEIRAQENKVAHAIELLESAAQDESNVDDIMSDYFPHNRKHCNWHFGDICEYKDLCWKQEVANDPLGSGLYQIREPHHEGERIG